MRHIEGATRLMEVRGVGAFKTEFEMALLTAHVGPAVRKYYSSVLVVVVANREHLSRWSAYLLTLPTHLP